MTTTENYDEDGNLIVQDTTDTIDYKELFEKEKVEKEKRENRFKGTAKELNEYKQAPRAQEQEDDGVNGANEYLKTHGSKLLREEGAIFRDDLDTLLEQKLQQIRDIEKLDKFPNLASQKDAILQLSKVDGLSIEETIKKYKFVDDEGMENFHKPTIGSRQKTPGSINMDNPTQEDLDMIKKMSPEAFDKFMGSS